MKNSEKILNIDVSGVNNLSESYRKCIAYFDNRSFDRMIRLLRATTDVMFNHKRSLEVRLLRHAEHEATGAKFINMVAGKLDSKSELRALLMKHALDETKHSRIFLNLARKLDRQLDIDYSYTYDIDADIQQFNDNLDLFLISIHAADIRNFFILDAYKDQKSQAYDFLPPSFFGAIDEIHNDEINHVSYTQIRLPTRHAKRNS